jgi:hypothetical protein
VASISKHPLLASLGGVLGIVEAVVPPAIFVVLFAVTGQGGGFPVVAVICSGLSAVFFIVVRILRREGATQAIAGLVTVGASVVLALISGRAENNFLPGIITNAAYGFAFLVSIFIGWPLVGVATGLLTKRGHGWRTVRREKKILSWLTVMWVAMFAVRLSVEVPLYLSQNVGGLAVAKLVLGLPLYAPVVMLTWLFVRGMFAEVSPISE